MEQEDHEHGEHKAHDSALSVGSGDDSVTRIQELESEVRFLAEKATAACMSPTVGSNASSNPHYSGFHGSRVAVAVAEGGRRMRPDRLR